MKKITHATFLVSALIFVTFVGFMVGKNSDEKNKEASNQNTNVKTQNVSPTSQFYPDRLCIQFDSGMSGDLSSFGVLSRAVIEKAMRENKALGTPSEVCAFDQFRASLEYELKGDVEPSSAFISSPADSELPAKIRMILVGFGAADESPAVLDVAIGKDLPGSCGVYTPHLWNSESLLLACKTQDSEVGEGLVYLWNAQKKTLQPLQRCSLSLERGNVCEVNIFE